MASLLLQILMVKAYLTGRYLWISTSANNSTFQFFIASVMNFITLSDILYIFRNLLSRIAEPYHRHFCSPSTQELHSSSWLCFTWGSVDQYTINHQFLFFPYGILSVFRVLVIIFSCYLSIQPFSYIFSICIFYSKIVLLSLHLVVGMSSCILHLLVGRIFFQHFGMSCFVCISWPYLGIF